MVNDMSTQPIYAEKTVSVTELRKQPSQFFLDEPVAVLSNNKTAGYILGPELFEQMIRLIETNVPTASAQFRPSSARLKAIAAKGAELILSTPLDDLGTFEE